VELLLTVLVTSALTSATYALIALGFSLVYGVGRTVNLAHGSFFMVGAYVAYAATRQGLPLLVGAAAGVAAAAALGLIVDRFVVAPSRHKEINVLIGTLAVTIAIEAIVRIAFGVDNKRLDSFADGAVSILGVDVLSSRVIAAVVSVIVVGAVLLVLDRSSVGRTVRAVAQDAEAARLMGIRTDRVNLSILALGGALAGLAGVLVAPYQVVQPLMWFPPLIIAFSVVILGGLGSLSGTLLAAGVLGFLDRLVTEVIPDGGTKAPLVTLVLILGTLVLRPQGIKGRAIA
jgi:branched-chain amino acid transport system permease protein